MPGSGWVVLICLSTIVGGAFCGWIVWLLRPKSNQPQWTISPQEVELNEIALDEFEGRE
jgi:hypothetical protein